MKLCDIARCACPYGPISISTLKRKFPEEVQNGKATLTGKVISLCTEMALSGKHPQVTMFWLRQNAGWGVVNERHTHDESTELVSKLQQAAKFAANLLPKHQQTGT
jgi:hypothetical protein